MTNVCVSAHACESVWCRYMEKGAGGEGMSRRRESENSEETGFFFEVPKYRVLFP